MVHGGGGGTTVVATVHRRVVGSRLPVRMVSPSRWMVTLAASKVAVHPASQSWPTESRDCPLRAGKRWATRAGGGRRGMSRSATCVELIVVPSAKRTVTGDAVVRLLLRPAASTARKCPVLPVSAMRGHGMGMGGEGPNAEFERATDSAILLGVPLCQLFAAGVVARGGGAVQMTRSLRRRWMMLQPPRMLLTVAVASWPGPRVRHVMLVWAELELRPWVQQ